LQGLSRFVAKNSPSNPAFIALVGSLSSNAVLKDRPEIQAIVENTLPVMTSPPFLSSQSSVLMVFLMILSFQCYVLAKASDDLDYVPAVIWTFSTSEISVEFREK
jgi:hypothetical protein